LDFRIADTFTDSLARPAGDEQKFVKTTALDLQVNPANPGMQFHRLDRSKDANFWSVRVNDGIRLIVHKTNDAILLCYDAQHDDAYRWASGERLSAIREPARRSSLRSTRRCARSRCCGTSRLSNRHGFNRPSDRRSPRSQTRSCSATAHRPNC